MLAPDEIAEIQQRLKICRRTLSHYLEQEAKLGSAHVPPGTIHGILEARENIRQLKATLQSWGVVVQDHPDDNEMPLITSTSVKATDQSKTKAQTDTSIEGLDKAKQESLTIAAPVSVLAPLT